VIEFSVWVVDNPGPTDFLMVLTDQGNYYNPYPPTYIWPQPTRFQLPDQEQNGGLVLRAYAGGEWLFAQQSHAVNFSSSPEWTWSLATNLVSPGRPAVLPEPPPDVEPEVREESGGPVWVWALGSLVVLGSVASVVALKK
jgi:hypothetical protein